MKNVNYKIIQQLYHMSSTTPKKDKALADLQKWLSDRDLREASFSKSYWDWPECTVSIAHPHPCFGNVSEFISNYSESEGVRIIKRASKQWKAAWNYMKKLSKN